MFYIRKICGIKGDNDGKNDHGVGDGCLRKYGPLRAVLAMIGVVIATIGMVGCGSKEEADMTVVLTTGFSGDEIFRIEEMSCTLPEVRVYLTNVQNQYESVYGEQIWSVDFDGVTLENNVKEMVLAQIAQIKTMNLLGEKYDITLEEEEKAQVAQAADSYFASLNETERSVMNVTEDTITTLYAEYALADKVYQYIIKDINPEISDDEARTITVQHILIKTYALNGSGEKVEYTEASRQDAYQRALDIRDQLAQGEDFEKLSMLYNEDEQTLYSFGKGEMEEAFENAAFMLETDEISEIVETSYGYHIIKCINTFNREETDANKIKIVEERRGEVFGQEYNAFVATLTKHLNDLLWEQVVFIHNEDVTTKDFFDVYRRYFPS
ncbi:MAG: peptidylprolyl isomerase [Lachnospiraceae bacterium]|nr:peptidylprolyl isomerase [Lachnospiraceae bacterium]